jgi:hypothetical protein
VGAKTEFAMPTGFLIKCMSYTFFKFAVRIIYVSPIEAKVVKIDHQLKVFRNVILTPILCSTIIGLLTERVSRCSLATAELCRGFGYVQLI